MDLTDEEELRRQRTGSRTTAHLDIAKTAEALRVGDPRGLQLAGHRSFVTVCYRRVPRGDDAVATLARRAANAGMFDLSVSSAEAMPPATCSGGSQTQPHRNPGDGKNQAS